MSCWNVMMLRCEDDVSACHLQRNKNSVMYVSQCFEHLSNGHDTWTLDAEELLNI